MAKQIWISDRDYDWLMGRGKGKLTPRQVLGQVVKFVDGYEAEMAKYNAWVKASKLWEKGANAKNMSIVEKPGG